MSSLRVLKPKAVDFSLGRRLNNSEKALCQPDGDSKRAISLLQLDYTASGEPVLEQELQLGGYSTRVVEIGGPKVAPKAGWAKLSAVAGFDATSFLEITLTNRSVPTVGLLATHPLP